MKNSWLNYIYHVFEKIYGINPDSLIGRENNSDKKIIIIDESVDFFQSKSPYPTQHTFIKWKDKKIPVFFTGADGCFATS